VAAVHTTRTAIVEVEFQTRQVTRNPAVAIDGTTELASRGY